MGKLHKCSSERNVQLLIQLLKRNGIKKIIVCPGATNFSFVSSVEYDGSFEIYSCHDERDAAYMACGLSVESGEPVVISCTMATAMVNICRFGIIISWRESKCIAYVGAVIFGGNISAQELFNKLT